MVSEDLIPNQWYPIFDSSRLNPRKPVGVTRLGERLVLCATVAEPPCA